MAKGNLGACLAVTLAHEGGYSDHPSDPGGATNMGITIGRLREVRGRAVTKADVKALTLDEAKAIYERYYWLPIRGGDLPAGVDLATFDFGVNSGPSRGVKYLQAVLGVAQDGAVGPKTIGAASRADGKAVIQKLCAKRLAFMQGLAVWSTFKRGWSRRVADVEAKAVAMWLRAEGLASATAGKVLADEAAKASKAAGNQNSTSTGVAGGSAVGGAHALAYDVNWLLIGAGVAVAAFVVVALIARARHNRERAAAYQAIAAAV